MTALPPAEGVLSCGPPERATAECEVAEACASPLPRRHCGGASGLDACRGRSTRLGLSRPECPYRLSSPSSPWQAVNRRSGKAGLAVHCRSGRLARHSRSLRRRRLTYRLRRQSLRTGLLPRPIPPPRSALEVWLQVAVAERSLARPRLSVLSWLAAALYLWTLLSYKIGPRCCPGRDWSDNQPADSAQAPMRRQLSHV